MLLENKLGMDVTRLVLDYLPLFKKPECEICDRVAKKLGRNALDGSCWHDRLCGKFLNAVFKNGTRERYW